MPYHVTATAFDYFGILETFLMRLISTSPEGGYVSAYAIRLYANSPLTAVLGRVEGSRNERKTKNEKFDCTLDARRLISIIMVEFRCTLLAIDL